MSHTQVGIVEIVVDVDVVVGVVDGVVDVDVGVYDDIVFFFCY